MNLRQYKARQDATNVGLGESSLIPQSGFTPRPVPRLQSPGVAERPKAGLYDPWQFSMMSGEIFPRDVKRAEMPLDKSDISGILKGGRAIIKRLSGTGRPGGSSKLVDFAKALFADSRNADLMKGLAPSAHLDGMGNLIYDESDVEKVTEVFRELRAPKGLNTADDFTPADEIGSGLHGSRHKPILLEDAMEADKALAEQSISTDRRSHTGSWIHYGGTVPMRVGNRSILELNPERAVIPERADQGEALRNRYKNIRWGTAEDLDRRLVGYNEYNDLALGQDRLAPSTEHWIYPDSFNPNVSEVDNAHEELIRLYRPRMDDIGEFEHALAGLSDTQIRDAHASELAAINAAEDMYDGIIRAVRNNDQTVLGRYTAPDFWAVRDLMPPGAERDAVEQAAYNWTPPGREGTYSPLPRRFHEEQEGTTRYWTDEAGTRMQQELGYPAEPALPRNPEEFRAQAATMSREMLLADLEDYFLQNLTVDEFDRTITTIEGASLEELRKRWVKLIGEVEGGIQ